MFRLNCHDGLRANTSTVSEALLSDRPTFIVRAVVPIPRGDRITLIGLKDPLLLPMSAAAVCQQQFPYTAAQKLTLPESPFMLERSSSIVPDEPLGIQMWRGMAVMVRFWTITRRLSVCVRYRTAGSGYCYGKVPNF